MIPSLFSRAVHGSPTPAPVGRVRAAWLVGLLALAAPLSAQLGGDLQPTGGDPPSSDPPEGTPFDPGGDPRGPGYTGPGDTPHKPNPGVPPGTPQGENGPLPGDPLSPMPPDGTPPIGNPFAPLPGGDVTNPTAPNTPLSRQLLSQDLTDWSWWWQFNKEPWLAVQSHLYSASPRSGADDFLGRSATQPAPNQRPSDTEVFGKVVPALLRVLAEERSDAVLAGSLVALARIGEDRPSDKKGDYEKALRRFLPHANPNVVESAITALGILGDEASAPLLRDLLLNARDGRDALGDRRSDARTRAFAAYALGLLGNSTTNEDVRRYAVHQLVWALETDRSGTPDVQAACVTALGLIPIDPGGAALPPGGGSRSKRDAPPPGSSLGSEVAYLLDVLGQRRRDRIVRAQVPLALGRLVAAAEGDQAEALRAEVVDELFDLISAHRREPREVVQSCVIALGMLGDNDSDDLDARIRRTLIKVEDTTNDLPARQLALIALGRVGGRAGTSPPSLAETRRYLIHELVRGGTVMRPWAALAIGILERGIQDSGGTPDAGTTKTLHASLAEAKALREIGAYSIAAGIRGDGAVAEPMLEKLRTSGDDQARGFAAVGLGMLPNRPAQQDLRELLVSARYRPNLLGETSIALAIQGDREVGGELVSMLDSAVGLAAQASIATALGRVGDASAVDPLLALLDDESVPDRGRAYAAAALGWVADGDDLPWSTVLSVDVNYHAAPVTLFDLQGRGILNLF